MDCVFSARHFFSKRLHRPFDLPLVIVKIFWIAFFLTFSEMALIAYIPFGLILKHKEERSLITHTFNTVVIVLLFVIALPYPYVTSYEKLEPRIYERQEDDWIWINEPQDPLTFTYKYNFGVNISNHNFSKTSAANSTNYARFACQRMVIRLKDDRPLVQEALEYVIEEFKKLPDLNTLYVLPASDSLPKSIVLPDVWLEIDVKEYNETYIPPTQEIQTQVIVTAQNKPFDLSQHHGNEIETVGFTDHLKMDYSSKTTRFGTHNKRYAMPAKELGKAIAELLMDSFGKLREKHNPMPDELNRFIPKPAEDVEPPIDMISQENLFAQGSYYMKTSLAYYVLEASGGIESTTKNLMKKLTNAGWKEESVYERRTFQARYSKGNKHFSINMEQPSPIMALRRKKEEAPARLILTHTVSMDFENELMDKLKDLLETDVSMDALLVLSNFYQRDYDLNESYYKKLQQIKTPLAICLNRTRAILGWKRRI